VLDPPLTGGCLCGAVRYAVTQPLVVAYYCHCTRCQRRTGSAAAVSALVVPGSLRITTGEELLASFDPSDGWSKVFCSACGGGLWAENPAASGALAVRMGTFDSDPGVRPSYRQFVAYAAPWEAIPDDGLPRYPERRPAS
jgi:hypothetical protein